MNHSVKTTCTASFAYVNVAEKQIVRLREIGKLPDLESTKLSFVLDGAEDIHCKKCYNNYY